MKVISYRYTNTFKQLLLIICMFYCLLCAIVVAEVVIFDVPGYEVNVIGGLFLYVSIFIIITLSLIGYKFCYTLYDDETVIYYNKLLKKEYSLALSAIDKVVLGKRGINFYSKDNSKNPLFYIPFFRGGIIEAIEIDMFYKAMKKRESITVIKEFTVFPGYGKGFTMLKVCYVFLSTYMLLLCAKPLIVIILLFQNFA